MHYTSFHRDRIGPYTLLRRIGREAAGEVWLVEPDSQIARTRLALKLLHADTADIIDIRREAQLWIEAANHPNVGCSALRSDDTDARRAALFVETDGVGRPGGQ